MRRALADLRIAVGTVLAAPPYAVLAAVTALLVFLAAVWLPNVELLGQVLASADVLAFATLAIRLLGGIGTNFSLLSAGYTIAIAVLCGIVTAMIVHAVRRRAVAREGIAAGSGALATGAVGIGCAACGTLMLSVIAPSLGLAAALAALPLQGQEFGILSVALLLVSLLLVSRSIVAQPLACTSPPQAGIDSSFNPHRKEMT